MLKFAKVVICSVLFLALIVASTEGNAGILKWIGYLVDVEGKVIEKNIGSTPKDNSFITVATRLGEPIVLEFMTRHYDSYIIEGEVFIGKAKELDKRITVGDIIVVDTYNHSGVRDVHRILSIQKPQLRW